MPHVSLLRTSNSQSYTAPKGMKKNMDLKIIIGIAKMTCIYSWLLDNISHTNTYNIDTLFPHGVEH